jgi:hypothetical protein
LLLEVRLILQSDTDSYKKGSVSLFILISQTCGEL